MISIDGKNVEFTPGETVLRCRARAGIEIPHLCSLDWAPSPSASCRLCVVEVEGAPRLLTSCTLAATDGMQVRTHTPRILAARRNIVELMVASHPPDCLVCSRSDIASCPAWPPSSGRASSATRARSARTPSTFSSPAIERDPNKCILCGRCVTMCHTVQGIGAIDFVGRGFTTRVAPGFHAG